MRKLFLISLFILFSVSATQADSIWNNGSVYSYMGLGIPNDYRGDFTQAMGIHGVAMYDIRLSNTANPAIWGHSAFTNISGGLQLRSHQVTDSGNTGWNNQLSPAQLQGVFPVIRNKIGISFSLMPVAQSGYNVTTSAISPAGQNNSGEDLSYTRTVDGHGGLNALEAGIGWRITPNISVGYAPSFVFGSYSVDSRFSFDNPNFQDTGYTTQTTSRGFRNRFGVYSRLPGFGGSSSNLAIGATAVLPVNLSVDREQVASIGNQEVTVSGKENFNIDGSLPFEAGFGFAYHFNNITTISSDVLYQNWSSATQTDTHSSFDVTDRIRFGIGTQINASRASSGELRFRERFNYRLGASYDTGHLKDENGQVQTVLINAGLGIPSMRSGSSVNINFEFGFRGNEINGALSENIYGVSISLSLSELMFIRSRIQ